MEKNDDYSHINRMNSRRSTVGIATTKMMYCTMIILSSLLKTHFQSKIHSWDVLHFISGTNSSLMFEKTHAHTNTFNVKC